MNLQLQILMVSKCQFLALVVQWLKLCATNSGCLVQPLVRKLDSTYCN